MAFGHVDDPVRSALAKADHHLCACALRVKRGAAAGLRRRKMRQREHARLQPLRLCSKGDALTNELRKHRVVGVLQFAATALREMAARYGGDRA